MSNPSDRAYWSFGLRVFSESTGVIAVPVVAAALLGRALDGRWGTGWIVTAVSLVLSFALSAMLVWRRAKEWGREFQEIADDEMKMKKAKSKDDDDVSP